MHKRVKRLVAFIAVIALCAVPFAAVYAFAEEVGGCVFAHTYDFSSGISGNRPQNGDFVADGLACFATSTYLRYGTDPTDAGNITLTNASGNNAYLILEDTGRRFLGTPFTVGADFYFAPFTYQGNEYEFTTGNIALLSWKIDDEVYPVVLVTPDGEIVTKFNNEDKATGIRLEAAAWQSIKMEVDSKRGYTYLFVNGVMVGEGNIVAPKQAEFSGIRLLQTWKNYKIYVDNLSVSSGISEHETNEYQNPEAFVYEDFAALKTHSVSLKKDGYIGIPVDMVTYVKDSATLNDRVALYVINHAMERVGTDSDEEIIGDLLDDGYVVVTLDYRNNALAVSPALDWSAQSIRISLSMGFYIGDVPFDSEKVHVIPAGCRIKTDIVYYDFSKSAAVGTNEYIVDVWNGEMFETTFGKDVPNGYFKANDISELIGKDGKPLDMTLKMDLIYPANPAEKVPAVMFSSCNAPTSLNGMTAKALRPQHTGFLFRGYAVSNYEHEYIPMLKSYGYMDKYTLAYYNGVKTHTAAARCMRYYAEDYGYDPEKVGVLGHSKSAYCALLSNPDPTSLKEKSTFSGHSQSETYGAQPFLTYRNSDVKIASQVQVCYSSMGDGAGWFERYVTPDTAPTVIASGYLDTYNTWVYWADRQAWYMKCDIPHLPVTMWDVGHQLPYGTDTVYKYDRYSALFDFFGYYLKDESPEALYTSADGGTVSKEDGLYVHFIGEMSFANIAANMVVFDETADRYAEGAFVASCGGTRWTFVPDDGWENGHTYTVKVKDKLSDVNGNAVKESKFTRFVYGA